MFKNIIYRFSLFLFFITTASFASQNRVALVIGNNSYVKEPLKNAVNDAMDIATTLEELNFKVIKIKNASHSKMEKAIRNFSKKISNGATGLFFFAGHGLQINNINYLIPSDNQLNSEDEIINHSVNAQNILDIMKSANNNMNIIILDACRNNPFDNTPRSVGRNEINISRGLAKMNPPMGSILAFSAEPGSVAYDGRGQRNGIYTGHLLKAMVKPHLAIEDVFKEVRRNVKQDTQSYKQPQLTREETLLVNLERFCFVEKGCNDTLKAVAMSSSQIPTSLNRTIFFDIKENNNKSRLSFGDFQAVFKPMGFKVVNNLKSADYVLEVEINVRSEDKPVMQVEGLELVSRYVNMNLTINSLKTNEILFSASSSGVELDTDEGRGKKIAAEKAVAKIKQQLIQSIRL